MVFKTSDPKLALSKAMKYCAYQERCHSEVRAKLYELGLWKADVERVLSELITEGFLNEERFAKAFAGGKFRIKKWGRIKIRSELRQKQVSEYCIQRGLEEIDEKEYLKTISELAKKRSGKSSKWNLSEQISISRYIISRGFEPDLVRQFFRIKD